ncbi:FCD domain-containing protein [Nocardioides sp.]|uniref:FadR/GntR family transcriptional regulator n=1 Tax=Nocardioides sp. TaxID=35761 RepID=UPI0026109656|nr:FCD domain-containing protein [Nocardioides sp.]
MTRLTPHVPLAEQVATQLRSRIATGEFPVGARMPTENELAAELGVSRNSMREAIRSLVHAGLLRARAGDGTYVIAASDLAPALARRLEIDQDRDVAEVRLLLEREGARLAALRASDEQRRDLRSALEARREASDLAAYTAADIAFHRLLLEASGNALLAELYRGAGGVEAAHRDLDAEERGFAAVAADMAPIDDAHAALVDAIVAGDPDQAEATVEQLVALVQDYHDDREGRQ